MACVPSPSNLGKAATVVSQRLQLCRANTVTVPTHPAVAFIGGVGDAPVRTRPVYPACSIDQAGFALQLSGKHEEEELVHTRRSQTEENVARRRA